MKFTELDMAGAHVIKPDPFTDDRGSFSRIFCQQELVEIGHTDQIVQVNHSVNKEQGTLRGLHYQLPPAGEIKIVKCIKGAIFDVIVDVRSDSETFLSWYGHELTASNMEMMYIPKGFAHGFQTLQPHAELIYFSSSFYAPDQERALHYKDPTLNIQWPIPVSTISERDQSHNFIQADFTGILI